MKRGLARGKQAIDARLDLHGLTQAQAHATLLHFLRNAQARDARLVLVITGKGARAEGERERGVLRRHVPQWLGLAGIPSLCGRFRGRACRPRRRRRAVRAPAARARLNVASWLRNVRTLCEVSGGSVMPRRIALLTAVLVSLGFGAAAAQTSMKPSAPQKMMSPEEAKKMRACEKQAADQNIKMDERSKFVMDCMTAKK